MTIHIPRIDEQPVRAQEMNPPARYHRLALRLQIARHEPRRRLDHSLHAGLRGGHTHTVPAHHEKRIPAAAAPEGV